MLHPCFLDVLAIRIEKKLFWIDVSCKRNGNTQTKTSDPSTLQILLKSLDAFNNINYVNVVS